MKIRLLLFAAIIFLSGNLLGQIPKKGYFNRTKLGFQPGVGYGSRPSGFEQRGGLISTVNGYQISTQLALGLGVALSDYQNPNITTIPVSINVDYYLLKKRSTPYIYGSAGYGFMVTNNLTGGIATELGTGWRFPIGKKLHIGPEIGYRYQSYGYKGYSGYRDGLKSVFIGFNIIF